MTYRGELFLNCRSVGLQDSKPGSSFARCCRTFSTGMVLNAFPTIPLILDMCEKFRISICKDAILGKAAFRVQVAH